MIEANDAVSIKRDAVRVEFDGDGSPSHLVVPLIFQAGKHKDIQIRVEPRSDVVMRNEVSMGDALQGTFSTAHTSTGGASFIASATHGRTFGSAHKSYEVVYLPDFQGVIFQLSRIDVGADPIGIQLAFPIERCDVRSNDDYFAIITLSLAETEIERHQIPREVHESAGKILLLSGYSQEFEQKVFGSGPRQSTAGRLSTASPDPFLSNLQRTFISISKLKRLSLSDLPALARGYDGVHLYTNVHNGTLLIQDIQIDPDEFFACLNGIGLKLLYLDTCDSIQVIRSFRNTDIHALIAATENLYVNYAEEFEKGFYDSLGHGDFVSVAFNMAASTAIGEGNLSATRSGRYDPMFLDLRSDFRFGDPASLRQPGDTRAA